MSQVFRGKQYIRNRLYRYICFCLVICLSFMYVPVTAYAADKLTAPSNLRAHHAYAVIDANTGKLLLGDHANSKVYPASTTKLMTAIAVLENEGNQVNKKVTITSAMLKQVPSCLARYGMKVGQKYTLNTLLHMSLIASDGDAMICSAIASFGSVNKCIKAMNKKVKSLKLSKTCFDNPAGLDIGDEYYNNYTTAYEMAIITKYAMENDIIRKIVSKSSYQVVQTNGKKGYTIKSTNQFYTDVSYDKDAYTIIGTKTGTTNAAGHVFAATAVDDDGNEVICVYMGKKSARITFEDVRALLDQVFSWLHNTALDVDAIDDEEEVEDEILEPIEVKN